MFGTNGRLFLIAKLHVQLWI